MEDNKVIVYDWDGTMADSLVLTASFLNDSLQRVKPDVELLPLDKPDEISKTMDRFRGMGKFLSHYGFSEEQIKEVKENYRSFASMYGLDFFPGIKDLIRKVNQQGASQLILSFNCVENVNPVLKRNMISPFMFDFVIGGDELKRFHENSKSDYINFYMGHRGMFPEEIYLVGDTKDDCHAALKSGINFIGVNYGFDKFEKDNGFPVVESVSELEAELMKL